MRDLIILLVHLITIVFQLIRPGGLRSVLAESVLIKHQLLIVNRSRRRAPNLRVLDRLIAGFCSLWIKPTRLRRAAIALKPSTVLHFHRALVQRKYRLLFSPKRRVKPGPTGPNPDVIRAIVDMKQRNPTWGSGVVRFAEGKTHASGSRRPSLSPPLKWVAYQCNESDRFEIYVQPFRGPGARIQELSPAPPPPSMHSLGVPHTATFTMFQRRDRVLRAAGAHDPRSTLTVGAVGPP